MLGEEGVVVLHVLVGRDGAVDAVRVTRNPGHHRLVEAAVEVIRRAKFIPATRAGKPVDAWVETPIRFTLR